MTQKQMQYFITVCHCGSLTKAAEKLYVSRPVVSRVVRDLEEEFSASLFIRTKTGISTTDQGNALKKFIEGYRASYNLLLERLHLYDAPDVRRLRIGISPTVIRWFFPNFYEPFHKLHKDIRLFVSELPAQELVDAVVNDEVDFGITPMHTDDTYSLGAMQLYESSIVFCASAASRFAGIKEIVREDIDRLPMALPPLGTDETDYPYSNPTMSIAQLDVLRMVIESGEVFSVLPFEIVKDWQEICLIPFKPQKKYNVKIIWNEMLPHNSEFFTLLEFANRSFCEDRRETE